MNPITITRYGMTVRCYGKWEQDSNAACVFEDEYFDNVWAEGASTWNEAVEIVAGYAQDKRTMLIEMVAC
tara:strand:+ start:226 stop:435 length:210 start_codon:yes stop_codon:yes gene_type:complete